jgi:hypothetical protein
MKLGGGFCQDILDYTLGEFSGTLVLLQNDPNLLAGFDFGTIGSVHTCGGSTTFEISPLRFSL